MSDNHQTPATATVVDLPPVIWAGGHPTVDDPEKGGQRRLRRCIRCNARSSFEVLSCAAGMVVHLIDPDDVHLRPDVFDGNVWAEPESIAGAHRYWVDKGFRVERKPDGPVGEVVHPRFRACPACNEALMRAGVLEVTALPQRRPVGRPTV